MVCLSVIFCYRITCLWRGHTGTGWPPNATQLVFSQGDRLIGRRYTGRKPGDDEDRGWSEATENQGMRRMAGSRQDLERGEEGFSPRFQGDHVSADPLISGSWPPELWDDTFLVSHRSACVALWWLPLETIRVKMPGSEILFCCLLVCVTFGNLLKHLTPPFPHP